MEQKYNMKSPAVKRLMREAQELHEPTEEYYAQPVDDNLFEWHFTVRGPSETNFEGGIYHGRIILPPEYPMKPPNLILLTPNGRFETHKKICLSISGHHPESWQPSWSIRTVLLAIIGFMPTQSLGAIGSLDYTPEERKKLAKKSTEFKCDSCGYTHELLATVSSNISSASKKISQEAKDLASQISFKGESSGTSESENIPSSSSASFSPSSRPSDEPSSNGRTNPEVTLVQNSNENWSTYLIAVLIVALAFLLFRRLCML